MAVKTSEKDELKEVDEASGLLSRNCPIRFIITKQALQEGWDCSFAYVLTILTNPNSQTALTQLVGRILRQPYAHKTRNRWLDESYVFCFQRKGTELMQEIRRGFGQEGLGDLEGRVVGDTQRDDEGVELLIPVRDKFKQAADSLVFPACMIRDGEDWRPVHYEPDLLSRVPWGEVDVSPVHDLILTAQPDKNVAYHKGIEDGVLADDPEARAEFLTSGWDDDLDYAFAASHLLDVMPNPWRGNEIARRVFEHLLSKYPRKMVVQNYVFVLDELHRRLGSEKDRLTREVFHDLLKSGVMRFMVVAEHLTTKGLNNKLPAHEVLREREPRAVKDNNLSFQMSLFDQMPAGGFNDFERSVATFLEDQEPLFSGIATTHAAIILSKAGSRTASMPTLSSQHTTSARTKPPKNHSTECMSWKQKVVISPVCSTPRADRPTPAISGMFLPCAINMPSRPSRVNGSVHLIVAFCWMARW